jgi:glycosyltransferase involved in cell wall biosynthesis
MLTEQCLHNGDGTNACQNKEESGLQEKELAIIEVDVIIPVHNAASTIGDAVESALSQEIPQHLRNHFTEWTISLAVCCYDDASTDQSWELLQKLQQKYNLDDYTSLLEGQKTLEKTCQISSNLWIQNSSDAVARGAGYARNRAVELGSRKRHDKEHHNGRPFSFLCLLDSDDIMYPTRVAEQVHCMMSLNEDDMRRTILGCTFDRDPPDSTWHYAQWANGLSDERLMLERFREVTIIQPTWMMSRSRFQQLGGYVEAPVLNDTSSLEDTTLHIARICEKSPTALIHPHHDTSATLKLAEDLRLFHSHVHTNGIIRLHRSNNPLVMYRHSGSSQSFRTPRKLLLQLRVLALERSILRSDELWQRHNGSFVVWGAGRDGKDFVRTLHADIRKRVYCFVDVDEKKIELGFYVNREIDVRIPIVHFSWLAKDPDIRERLHQSWIENIGSDNIVGRIDKGKPDNDVQRGVIKTSKQPTKKRRTNAFQALDSYLSLLPSLPVVVCVAMYRTNGVLEMNVKAVGREEGIDLWHFS